MQPITAFALAAPAALAMLAGACMTAGQREAQGHRATAGQCFRASEVHNFRALDRDTVLVFAGGGRVYELEISGTCPQIDWASSVGIRSTSGGSWVCSGLNAELLVPSPLGFDRCPVLGVRQLSPEDAHVARGR